MRAQFVCSLLFLHMCVSSLVSAGQLMKDDYVIEEVADGLNHPWSLAFLPNGEMLIAERNGGLVKISDGSASQIDGLPNDVFVAGQGGLQDIVLHPEFSQNNLVYLSYAAGNANANQLKVIRAQLQQNTLLNIDTVFAAKPMKDTPVHYGARMAFMADGTLLVTTGDGFDYREDAQRLSSQLGKIIRIHDDGSLPKDNPFLQHKEENARYIYSLGHRNPQGMVLEPRSGKVFAHEHGPAGGDEINIIESAKNYGWPVITFGKDYSGAMITPFTEYDGMEQPLHDWTPSIAPSGMAYYDNKMFPSLNGGLLIGSLKFRDVRWVKVAGGEVESEVVLFDEIDERIRDVRVAGDGSIYLLTDSANGRLLRIRSK
ncbi:PQQ-dependent sugar dehydrogenase [Aestuariibacter sp. AA17]|uniref:PQQ-dependent sugar dehydrogenase n=1 Tax=Fluctibacter corallii TaxID=2984329 RepID=A0ABT3A4M3_9ALTE|nr:PQQ-dependent sugar dehydrogenase [Aestuariibacter sp. AA17]MCV2883631.1 PQQ-dependent sugar dehydrogenase [Aestuariibacter sp. AA17]